MVVRNRNSYRYFNRGIRGFRVRKEGMCVWVSGYSGGCSGG